MRKMLAILGALVGLAVLTNASPAVAAPAHGCHVISSSTQTQTRDVTGVTAAATKYGAPYIVDGKTYRKVTRYTYSGVQSRTVTTTTTKCKGQASTATSTSSWAGAQIIATTTTQRIS